MRRQKSFYRPIHQALLVVLMTIGILAALAALYTVRWIFIAALIGIGLGILIAPPASALRKRYRIPRVITSLLLLIVFFGAFFSVAYFLVSMISDQIIPLTQKLPGFIHELQAKLVQIAAKNPWLGREVQGFKFENYLSGFMGTLVSGLRFGASAIEGMVFIFFLSLYFAIRPEPYLEGFVSAFPHHMREKTRRVLVASAQALRGWFWAQLTAMITVGIVAAVALRIAGSQYWLFFGAITAVLELVPYFGPLTAFVTVALVTLMAAPHDIVKTGIAFFVVLSLEGNVIIPLIMKGRIDLRPIHLLVLMTIMGSWFGVFGFLMAAPTLAVGRTIYIRAYLPKMDEQIEPPSELPARPAA